MLQCLPRVKHDHRRPFTMGGLQQIDAFKLLKVAFVAQTSQSINAYLASFQCGELLIRGFWAQGTDCILYVRVTDTDAKPYSKRDPAKVLESQEKEKKRKCLEACLERHRHFTPFACSVDGMLGPEARTFAKCLGVVVVVASGG
jgi:hypothetical protein